ncbi:flagellar biosynthetic protein FliR [Mariniblastus fucicola]|uniref:Flagellar biosynthesis protein FliR n=1 Tax=Mariniblastus fucicola TaxID=980251 RepID=A0A5B9PDT7_9BACT|nr:flagellar biosynthetic protein FliR [Mariniblastus fucicola]QEG23365.1 flagellar biosynthesis protein FliR [Mariniblastus fucicola]
MISEVQVVAFVLVLARVSAFVAFFPLFAKRQIPNTVKVGLAVGLTWFWYGMVEAKLNLNPQQVTDLNIVSSTLLMMQEVTIGVVLSIALGLFFLPAKIAGSYIGQELGLSLASISDPGSQDSSTLISRVCEAFAILIFFGINMHHFLILVIHGSFDQLFGKIDVLRLPTEELVALLNRVNDYGFLIVGPVAILFMLVTLGLAYLNKAAPTLNLFSVGMSIRSGFGIFCLLVFCPVIFGAIQAYFYRMQADVEEVLTTIASQ